MFELKKGDVGVSILQFTPEAGRPFGDDVDMWCSREDAEQLLAIANQHCINAVYPIQQALTDRP
jgi:hypothetical protein